MARKHGKKKDKPPAKRAPPAPPTGLGPPPEAEGEHDQLRRRVEDHLEQYLGEHLSVENRAAYRRAARAVFALMPAEALRRYAANVEQYVFFNDLLDLNQHIYPHLPERVMRKRIDEDVARLGYYDRDRKELVMNGPDAVTSMRAIFAHEAGHAIVAGQRFTGRRTRLATAWNVLWAREMNGRVGREASDKPYEGIAHFLSLWYSGKEGQRKAAGAFPSCRAFLTKEGLI